MEDILEELNRVPGVMGSMVVGKDGLAIVSIWDSELDMDMVGALSADIFNATESMIDEKFNYGETCNLIIEAENARFIVQNIDEATFLAMATKPNTNLGLIRIESRKAATRLREAL